jgi:phospholipid transport system substrate-binding protein
MKIARRQLLVTASVAAVAALAGTPARAQDVSKEAAELIRTLGDRTIKIIADKTVTRPQRTDLFLGMLREHFDMAAIGRFTLGRYWRTATPDQQSQFLALFEQSLVHTYASRLGDYKGETFNIANTRSEGDNHAMVGVLIDRPGEAAVRVDWRILKRGDRLRVVDLIVEGISLSVTQQQEFGSVIQRNNGQIDPLLAVLRDRIAAAKAS